MRKPTKGDIIAGFIFTFIVLIAVLPILDDLGILDKLFSFGPSEFPKKISEEQLQSLRLTSFISLWCLPDSIDHYMDSLVLKDSSALLFRYDHDATYLLDMIKSGLQEIGFVITDQGTSNLNTYDFYWLSAENGNIFVHVTMLHVGGLFSDNTYICIASGKNVDDVLSIKICVDDSGYPAELISDRTYTPTNANLVMTAPLSGTVYALFYPNNPLCGNPDDEINVITANSFDELLLREQEIVQTYGYPVPIEFYWACGNFYKPERFKPVNAFVFKPRGVAYAQIMDLDVK
jgi:hypothetical protein